MSIGFRVMLSRGRVSKVSDMVRVRVKWYSCRVRYSEQT